MIMICKWCGGKLASSDIKCARCGREVPALSDCGGFYDLVPGAKSGVRTAPVPAAPEKQEKTAPEKVPGREVPGGKPKGRVRMSRELLIAAGAAFALVLLLLLIISGRVNRNYRAIEALQERLNGFSAETNRPQEDPGDDLLPPADTTPDDPGLFPQDTVPDTQDREILLTIRLVDSGSGLWAEGSAELGTEEAALVLALQERENEPVNALRDWSQLVRFSVQKDLLAGCLEIQNVYNGEYGNVYMRFTSEGGDVLTADSYKWSYRTGNEDWQEIIDGDNSDEFYLLEDSARLNFARKWMADTLTEQTELRCEMVFTDENGAVFTIVVEGIGVAMD